MERIKIAELFIMFNEFYKNKKILVTGHTGFKGSWLALWLHSMGAKVCGYALKPNTNPSLFNIINLSEKIQSVTGNILDKNALEKTFSDFNPEIVFHLAAQPLVRLSYFEPLMTYETNVIGTLNVLEAARKTSSLKAFVNITTDKCYENKEVKKGYCEDDPMGGYDMYSSSKGCVEIMSASYRRSFLSNAYAMATARAGNVVGGGDWAQDRLIPDCIKAIQNNETIVLRNPNAVRPWQHVLEPLAGYLILAQKLYEEGHKYAEGFNFGPGENSFYTVKEVAEKIVSRLHKGKIQCFKADNLHEAGLLMLNIEKAKKILGWYPKLSVDETIKWTVDWYGHFYAGDANMIDFSLAQIKEYATKKGAS